MPLLPPLLRNTIAFIYRNKRDAEAGKNFQAVGFFVRMPSAGTEGQTFFVTNWHVLRDIGVEKFVIRMNTTEGFTTIPLARSDFAASAAWDIAAAHFPASDPNLEFAYIAPSNMLQDWVGDFSKVWVGAGDDVVMPCRIVSTTQYKTRNITILRFGNVSLSPEHEEMAFIVEMRSIAGHSGSPVFYYDMGLHLHGVRDQAPQFNTLIGINRGHLPNYDEVVSSMDIAKKTVGKKPPKYYAVTNMAMSQVIPAWKILELLQSAKLQKRQSEDRRGDNIVEDR